MAASDIIVLFLPLTIVVSLEISSVVRNINLLEVTHPNELARFSFLHLSNVIILVIGLYLVLNFRLDDVVGSFSTLIVLLVLLALPILEVDEYDRTNTFVIPRSFFYHSVLVTWLFITAPRLSPANRISMFIVDGLNIGLPSIGFVIIEFIREVSPTLTMAFLAGLYPIWVMEDLARNSEDIEGHFKQWKMMDVLHLILPWR